MKSGKLLCLLSLLILTCSTVWGQDKGELYRDNPGQALKDAKTSFLSGGYDNATKLVGIYLALSDDTNKSDGQELLRRAKECQGLIEEALRLEADNKYSDAAACYKKVLNINPNDSNARKNYDAALKKDSASKTVPSVPIIPTQPSTTKRPSRNYLKPERYTVDVGVIAGSTLGFYSSGTLSYFLIGVGVDWLSKKPEKTMTTNLINSGYTGNFTKSTTLNLDGSCTNIFLELGGYFKYFSVSCQVGFLCGTNINRSILYEGSGYGLIDGDVDEYWGDYSQRTLTRQTSEKESCVTITPLVKGYIPIGKKNKTSISLGLGYTFIPSLEYSAGLSASLGVHFRFH